MLLKDFDLKQGNHFVAMEYWAFILNRTFLILITDEFILGLKVNGVVSVEVKTPVVKDVSAAYVNSLAIKDNLDDPYSYVKQQYWEKMKDLDIFGDEILSANKANFRISLQSLNSVKHNPKKKWGMGYYPHDGRVYVGLSGNKKREFIILGNQSGENICEWIRRRIQVKVI